MGKRTAKAAVLVVEAIKNLRSTKGFTPKEILQYLLSKYELNKRTARCVLTALKRGVEYGVLKADRGKYALKIAATKPLLQTDRQTEDDDDEGNEDCGCHRKRSSRRKRSKRNLCKPRKRRRSRRRSGKRRCGGQRRRRRRSSRRKRSRCRSSSRRRRSRRRRSRKRSLCKRRGSSRRRRRRSSSRKRRRGCGGKSRRITMSDTVAHFVETKINSDDIVIFSKSYCPYCKTVKKIFDKMDTSYTVIELDHRDDESAVQDVLREITGARTVPRVFLKEKFIGGGTDVEKLYKNGTLKKMIGA